MDDQITRIIAGTRDLDGLLTVRRNAEARGRFDAAFKAALDLRAGELARDLIARRTGLILTDLTPAEGKIVEAVSIYAGVMKRDGKDPTRTLLQLKRRGLIEAAQAAVIRPRPAQGFQVLAEVGRADLSFEQIIIDYPEEFTGRAVWHARRTLGLPNALSKPPASRATVTQEKSAVLLTWLRGRRDAEGRILRFSNAEGAAGIGWTLQSHGRPYGNIQSRLDFACYRAGLPPLGLTAVEPFERAWDSAGRTWSFPIAAMQRAAQAWSWRDDDLDAVAKAAADLPGASHVAWQDEIARDETSVRAWAEGLGGGVVVAARPEPVAIDPMASHLAEMAALELQFHTATPQVRARVSRTIERGPVGAAVKRANGYRCQVCAALDLPALGFRKRNGEPYVEAHHVMPVSALQVGSLSASNILTVCANHHRQLHFGVVDVVIAELTFELTIEGRALSLPRRLAE